MEELKKEILRKGITMVIEEKLEAFLRAKNGGYVLQAYLRRVEYQQALALASN